MKKPTTAPAPERIPTTPCPRCAGQGKLPNPEGGQMRRIRETAGKTQGHVASFMGISIPYLSDLENGKRDWNHALLSKFTAALK